VWKGPAPLSEWVPPEGSWASSPANRRAMLGNRSRDTRPERALRSAVHRRGLRFRVALRPVPSVRRTADLVFTRARIAVFLDGCYWHGCPVHYVEPSTNTEYWRQKIQGNVTRDRETDRRLSEEGWLVLRFWEHEDPEDAANTVARAVGDRGVKGERPGTQGTAEPPQ
jgi:DNA mismatch endonuclease, patch repair protein